ncbi:Zinc/cadmium resistance protein [Frankliniella fusca]|uniref:Zinc/cadmium resistance protein n=1 Tax=Frankliniella fusca TaxID=407009 RepID=A0AAE1L6C1_9NEOP|nr:Zinc/cadmium resistance protein [Frankliniella fusca]
MVRANAALPLYVMLGLTTALFGVQLALSHLTHALTLLVDSYHMLCNLIALTGCIITIKKGIGGGSPPVRSSRGQAGSNSDDSATEHSTLREGTGASAADRRLRNTFGWARIDVLVSLIGTVFLASLCFSLLVEAVQTLLHIDHHDEMHQPLYVAGAGVASLALNVLCYVMLGGYTFHQGSFFRLTKDGDVVLDPTVTQDSVKMGDRRLSAQRRVPAGGYQGQPPRQRQGCREMLRDTVGCVFVIAAAVTVFFTDQNIGKYADPLLSIVSAVLLLVLSYPYMKEAGLILLQTIPEHINIEELRTDFRNAFPVIVDIHDLHVWRLNQSKVFCTAHIVFRDARDYLRVNDELTQFFLSRGVTQVTVQPEFSSDGDSVQGCKMSCPGESCLRAHCCAPTKAASPPAGRGGGGGAARAETQHYLRIGSDLSLPSDARDARPGRGLGRGGPAPAGGARRRGDERLRRRPPAPPARTTRPRPRLLRRALLPHFPPSRDQVAVMSDPAEATEEEVAILSHKENEPRLRAAASVQAK